MSSVARLDTAVLERFYASINKEGPEMRPGIGQCYVWTGEKNSCGYGVIRAGRAKHLAHRVAWVVGSGEVPKLCVLHRCDGGGVGCVRFDHLFLGTKAQNTQDMLAKGRNRSRFKVGESVHTAKLSDSQVDEIRTLSAAGCKNRDLAIRFGVSHSNIWLITSGRSRVRAASHDHVLSDAHLLNSLHLIDKFVSEHGGSHAVARLSDAHFECSILDGSGTVVASHSGTTPGNARFAMSQLLLKVTVAA